ncbi:Quinoprotein glucose dehydrogenase B precursor [Botrimarina colliarenosi]|uniref:Quinoprotein glucose dehydrogenase B n=1 Tax=Botrimarina colliarenosi TaxID=2528001 RepID=A0A5C6AHA9_9BACT|nr:PQQ-dependent sugar dehydrogenase [Botrimarina colliarenosi]TWT97553.1 Quinoprotein glucose dehydrogenase B precursor [Botrimarina colliarenosi]
MKMQLRLRLVGSVAVLSIAWVLAPAQAQVAPPILPGISVEIADILQMPDTRGQGSEDSRVSANVARINFLREIPGSPGEWIVNDLRGQVYRVDPATQQATTFLNVGDEFSRFIIGPGGLSTGLITVELHPEFLSNGKFYTIHEESASGNPGTPDFQAVGNAGNLASGQHGVVIEWTANDPTAATFSGTHRELMRIAQPSGNLHNLGDIGFNPLAQPGDADYGMMYLAGGDAGYDSEGKGSKQARVTSSIFGKLLRIDPLGSNSANGQYGIPADNPYAGDGDSGTLDEIYAMGFRNLHRIGWDLETGLFIGTDIGQSHVEEVNLLRNGGDYGWDFTEGTFGRGGATLPRDTEGVTFPAAQYDHADGSAIAGGFVYRGAMIPELVGKFVYGDIVNGRLFYSDVDEMIAAEGDSSITTTATVYELFLTQDGAATTLNDLVLDKLGIPTLPRNRHDLRFGQTSDGELYVITKQDGMIRQLVGDGLVGDYNGDGLVDAADYTVWRDTSGQTGAGLAADGDGDGEVDSDDYGVWASAYGSGGSTSRSESVPEPAGVLAALLASAATLMRRRASR